MTKTPVNKPDLGVNKVEGTHACFKNPLQVLNQLPKLTAPVLNHPYDANHVQVRDVQVHNAALGSLSREGEGGGRQ